MYMSYCRFEGTKHELGACMGTVEEHVNEEAEYEVSENEVRHFREMVVSFVDFLNDMCLLEDYAEINDGALDEVCEAMKKSYGGDDYE